MDPATQSTRTNVSALLPGRAIGEGRYRLLAQFGVDDRNNAQFWRARDGQLRRDVALTVLVGNAGDYQATLAVRRTLERATHAARFSHPGIARVLDVLSVGAGIEVPEGVLGIVVSDWSQGTELIDLVAVQPMSPGAAAKLLESLAAAVDAAHHAGLVLGIDHPQRIMVGRDGVLKLAFPGPLPDATLRDDVKGLGAILYLLLTGSWPLRGGPPGLPVAPTGPDGIVLPPDLVRPHVPEELAAAAVRSLEDTSIGGIRTSAALLRALEHAAEIEAETERLRPLPGQAPRDPDDGSVWITPRPVRDDVQRRRLAMSVGALTVATVGVIAWLGLQLISFFSDSSDAPGAPSVVAAPTEPSARPPQGGAPPAGPSAPIEPAAVRVYAVKGDKDNATRVSRAVDGNQKTVWSTDSYKQPFPALKPGIGIMASFAETVRFTTVAIDSPSANTVVEIRSAATENAKLAETTVIGTATLTAGHTEITLTGTQPAQHLLIWITKLGGGGQNNASQITELSFVRAQ